MASIFSIHRWASRSAGCFGSVVLAAVLAATAGAQSGPARFTHPSGRYAASLPANVVHRVASTPDGHPCDWFGSKSADAPGGPVVGAFVHLFPIPNIERLQSDRLGAFANAHVRAAHSGVELDVQSGRESQLAGLAGTSWPLRALDDKDGRAGEMRLVLLRDAILAVALIAPRATLDRDLAAHNEWLKGLTPLDGPKGAAPPAVSERASTVAARYKGSVPRISAVSRLISQAADLGPAPAPTEQLHPLMAGTGFVVSANGYVITNRHVVEHLLKEEKGLERFTYDPVLLTWDSRARKETDVADVVAISRQWDLALLKIRGNEKWTPFPPSDMARVEEAQEVLVMGWPNVGSGAPSLLHHNVNIIAGLERDESGFTRIVRHGARTTAGNSGGPLYGLETGGIVGVHSAGYTNHNHGYDDMFQHAAVPIDRVMWEFPWVFEGLSPEPSLEDRHARLAFYYQQERFGSLVGECRRILEKHPDDGLAHAYFYRALRMQGEPLFASAHLAPAVADEKSKTLTHIFSARSALEEGDVTTLREQAARSKDSLMLAYATLTPNLFEIAFEESQGVDAEARVMQGAAELRRALANRDVRRFPLAEPFPEELAKKIEKSLVDGWLLSPGRAMGFAYLAIFKAAQGEAELAQTFASAAMEVGGHDGEVVTALAYYFLVTDQPLNALAQSAIAARARLTPASLQFLAMSMIRVGAHGEALSDAAEIQELVDAIESLGMKPDFARMRKDGTQLLETLRAAFRTRQAANPLTPAGGQGWWDFALTPALEKEK